MFKNCAPLTDCKNETNNLEIDNAKDIDITMPIYNLIEYIGTCSKTSESLWQCCKDILAVSNGVHCVKSVHVLSYSDSHFSTFRLNTERLSECGKMRTSITLNTDTFYRAVIVEFDEVNLTD